MSTASSSEGGSEPALPPLREVIARHGLGARKALGQHFLFDMNLTRRIARSAGDLSEGTVIEVGPGPGGLTRALLLEGAASLVAIERDERCLDALAELGAAFPGRLRVVAGDALEVEAQTLGPAPRRIVANLPYNVSTQLLVGWLELIARDPRALSSLVLMFQKEVALRLTAVPRSKDYGRLSVLTQWLTQPEILFDVSPKAFVPPPKVTSSVARLVPRDAPSHPARLESLQKVTAAAFGQRRKMLRQSLKTLTPAPLPILEAAGVKETARAEELSVADFCRLAEAWDAAR